RNSPDIPVPPWRTASFQSEELAHVAIVLFLSAFRAQVEAEFVDDLDAVIADPVHPAIRTYRGVNALADLVGHRRLVEFARAAAGPASGPLAAEAAFALRAAHRFLLRHRLRLTQFRQHARHRVARHVVALLVGHVEALLEHGDRLVTLVVRQQA